MPDVSTMTAKEQYAKADKCPGGGEAHNEHLFINGDCPWCDVFDQSKWAPPSEDRIGPCALCGEEILMLDVEHGNIAEMNDPIQTHCHGIVHTTCGQAKGWEVS